MAASVTEVVVPNKECHRFVVECMVKAGTDLSHASQLADVLIAGDYRGHYSHGINRIEIYFNDVVSGACKGTGTPRVLNERGATAWVDGGNLLGPVVGNFCIDLAIKKAKEVGIGMVVAKGSNHYGIAGYYSMRAAAEGMVGVSMTNTSPFMFPTRSSAVGIGTNPISVAANSTDGDAFVLDMATTAVAVGKVEICDRKGVDIPAGWAVDKNGLECHNTDSVLRHGGGLFPLGGPEISGGYKGYGLGMMVELFCGVLAGAKFGNHNRRWGDTSRVADLGQCFMAIDPEAFAPGFADRLKGFSDECRELKPINEELPVLIPGDPERQHMKLCDELGGIPYHPNQIAYAKLVAENHGLTAMHPL